MRARETSPKGNNSPELKQKQRLPKSRNRKESKALSRLQTFQMERSPDDESVVWWPRVKSAKAEQFEVVGCSVSALAKLRSQSETEKEKERKRKEEKGHTLKAAIFFLSSSQLCSSFKIFLFDAIFLNSKRFSFRRVSLKTFHFKASNVSLFTVTEA